MIVGLTSTVILDPDVKMERYANIPNGFAVRDESRTLLARPLAGPNMPGID